MDPKTYVVAVAEVKGNFTIHNDGNVSFTVTTSDEAIVDKLAEFIGTGTTRKVANGRGTIAYKYILQRRADVDALARKLMPELTPEARSKAGVVRDHLDAWFDENVDPISPQRAIRVTL